ncbi:hypothetical protein TNCV_466011 [Trichonephila clavipes]|nr:hypothetical protein TNCV_466011 [Trichonephila clavipes]
MDSLDHSSLPPAALGRQEDERKRLQGNDDDNEMNNEAPVFSSSRMKNIMKSMRSYLDAHSNGEMNNKMNNSEQFAAEKDNAKRNVGGDGHSNFEPWSCDEDDTRAITPLF